MVSFLMVDKLGRRTPLEPPWQQNPDVSAHIRILLPSDHLSAPDWQPPPDVSTHLWSLPLWLQG